MADITIEFTIEPFTDGAPGAHVTRAIEAVEALGVSVEIGPCGSTVVVDETRAGEVLAALTTAAYEHGATHVTIDTEKSASA
jgi:uncharacterized protein YqgV (UPF0045/DUF77 family)